MIRRAYSYLRFSTAEQRLGSSEKRQLEAARKIASERGWELVELATDEGISAYHGANVESGSLGKFLRSIKDGEVSPGSVLIVESIDRLSRQLPFKGFHLVSEVVSAGITLLTLEDGQEYSPASVASDPSKIFLLVGSLHRAHTESLLKSQRLKAAWKLKRAGIDLRKITGIGPAWLKYDKESNAFTEIPERAQLVKKMFDWSSSGLGDFWITREINKQGIKPWGRGKAWQESYIKKILTNRAVIGEFVPHEVERIKGKVVRRPTQFNPIKDYYPAVVSDEVFFGVAEARRSRAVSPTGRKGEHLSNLFSGLLRCGVCREPIWYINKGRKPKGGTYLCCSIALRKGNCRGASWPYDAVEEFLLQSIVSLNIQSLLTGDLVDVFSQLSIEKNSLLGELATNQAQQERLTSLVVETGRDIPAIGARLQALANRKDEIELRVVDIDRQQAEAAVESVAVDKEGVADLIGAMRKADDANRFAMRMRVSQGIRRLVARIDLIEGHIIYPEEVPTTKELVGDKSTGPSEHLDPAMLWSDSPGRAVDAMKAIGLKTLEEMASFLQLPAGREKVMRATRSARITYRVQEAVNRMLSRQDHQYLDFLHKVNTQSE